MERDSSDEEDDRENLIDQNGRDPKPTTTTNHHGSSSFEISSVGTDIHARIRRKCGPDKKRLLATLLPLVVIIVFFSVFDVRRIYQGIPTVSFGSSSTSSAVDNRMRESELRALYLLRDQQLGLLKILNRTSPEKLNSNSTSPSPISMQEFRSQLLMQIRMNRQIQQTLLSSHRFGNASALTDENVDLELSGGFSLCRKADKIERQRTIEWKPKKNRYLFAICLSGQMSNHLICLEKHMFFAALLGRVLVLPSPKFDYHYEQVIDIQHINNCFGRTVVMTFEEFAEQRKHKMQIDRFICYVSTPPCYLDEDHIKKLKSLGLSMGGKPEPAWPNDGKPDEQKKHFLAEIVPKFSSEDEVLAIGEMFYADVEEEWLKQPGGPLAQKCGTVIQPSRLIMLTAQRFVQTFLGSNFIALHFRRHGFLKFCNVKKESCFFPIPQAAECILRVAERANAPVIYLSTDAAESETNLLQSLITFDGKTVPLVKRPVHTSAEKWDALLQRNHIHDDSQVEAMLDKTICAMSTVFVGSSGSTFTDDIYRLRKDWGSASVCDEYLCKGEQPNFIAGNE
ncbi:hypothetical protein QJS04_geneDACA004829 [Acorus gramineus]|uniref:GDP-fucose protein O-fucosyltransferase 2 n=1 Tax=Acorus gramineus TaxID=55184 RepID=A0AAV9BXT0_ACOGR|nr:hypothetical protein QJS04_geneDACA004829 [Acorus gramineus]